MKKFVIQLDRHEQYLLKYILTKLVDKDNTFRLNTLTEQACAVNEALRLLRKFTFINHRCRFSLQYYQVTILWKILYCYPCETGQLEGVRLLMLQLDKYYQTILIQFNYEVQNKTYSSAANMLAANYHGSNA